MPSSSPLRHFTEIRDLNRSELESILQRAQEIHRKLHALPKKTHGPLQNSAVVYLSSKESLRTQCSIEQAATYLGGHAVSPGLRALRDETGKLREPVSDMVRCLEEQGYPLIFARLHHHDEILEMSHAARRASVVNALTDQHHPLQALADAEAFLLHRPTVKKPKIVFLGDGNNVATSLGQISAMLGWDFVHSGSEERKIHPAQWQKILELADVHGGSARFLSHPEAAVEGAHFVYADEFASMGEKEKIGELQEKLAPYRVTSALMARAASDALFGHCLPAERGREVDTEVIDGPQSIVFSIAGCRTDTTAALMEFLLEERRR